MGDLTPISQFRDPNFVTPISHALLSLASVNGEGSIGYSYDANGNLQTASAGKYRSIAYTSFNLPDVRIHAV